MVLTDTAQLVYQRPELLADVSTHYCPGCTHGVAHRLIAEVLDDMDLRERTIGVAPVGCSVFAYNYFDCDFVGGGSRSCPRDGYRGQEGPARPQLYSPIKVMATWHPSAWLKSSMLPDAARILP